ncbi:MAG: hypothetical protein AAB385_06695, partial [Planctomycetota bacterium]
AARGARRAAAAFAALLFGLHPIQVEAVALAGSMADVLSSVFVIYAVFAYLRGARARGGRGLLLLAWVLTLCACMSRWHGVLVCFFLVVLDVYPLGRLPDDPRGWLARGVRPVLVEKLPFALLSTLFMFINGLTKVVETVRVPIPPTPWEAAAAFLFVSVHGVASFPRKISLDSRRSSMIISWTHGKRPPHPGPRIARVGHRRNPFSDRRQPRLAPNPTIG